MAVSGQQKLAAFVADKGLVIPAGGPQSVLSSVRPQGTSVGEHDSGG